MYSEQFQGSLKAVEAARAANVAYEPARMTAQEKDDLLAAYHPDYKKSEFATLKVGPNKGESVPHELCELLQSHSRISADDVDLNDVRYDVDVLIIGGGGAGASAAIEANNAGANVMIVTKLRIGDANTMMAEGGIQAADKPNDSPAIHFLDAFGGGHFAAKRELLSKLVCDAPEAIQWLNNLGVEFDKAPDGTMITTHGGGTSRKRMHAAKDYSGAEIMRTLRDEVLNRGIPVVDFTAAIELILDENGRAAGAVLMNMETKELMVARAKTVIIATGGAGRMHYQGFPTSNHYGATADGLVLGYRVGAKLLYADTLQYHPTGAAFPQQIFGALVTEKVRSLGAKLVNRDGKVFMHPLETRDVAAASIIRECSDRHEGCGHRQRRSRLAGHPHDRNDRRRRHHRGPHSRHDAYVCPVRHRHPQGAHSGLPDPALPERRSGHQRQRHDHQRGEPLRGGRGRRRHPRPEPSDGQLPSGHHRLWPQRRSERRRPLQGSHRRQADPCSHRRFRKGMRRRGHRHRRRLPQAPPRLPQAGLKPCTHLCAAMPRRVLVGYASWPGFYRRGTTGATARRSGAAPGLVAGSDRRSATGLAARRCGVIPCLLACTDRHSATGLMARNEGQHGFQNHAGLWRGRASQAAQQHPNLRYFSSTSLNWRRSRAAIGSEGKKPCPF